MAEDKTSWQKDSADLGAALRGAVENKVDELGLAEFDYVRAALKWQYNWIGLAGAAAFALVSGTGLPLVLAAGMELIYVSLVPRSSAFRRLVRSWQYAEQKRSLEMKLSTMWRELPPDMRKRYEELCHVCREIRQNYGRLSSTSQMFVQQMEDRLQGLPQAYLRLLYSVFQHRDYLRTLDPGEVKRDIDQLQKTLESELPKVQEINRRRIEILEKRLEKFENIRENCRVIDAQCKAVEDVLELIRDQSVTMSDPQQLSEQLESLMHDVEQTEETVRQVESIFQMATPELAPLPAGEPGAASGPARTRVRN